MSTRKDFDQAKQFQLDWMFKIREFLDGVGKIDDESFNSHLNSKLGKWYYAEGKSKYGGLDPIKKFEVKQVKLHKIVKEILHAKEENQTALAEELYEDLVSNSKQIIDLLSDAENNLIKNTFVKDSQDESYSLNADKSVAWDKTKILISKTDANGIIEYVNDVFLAVSGYDNFELIEKSHNVVRHPDMPKVIFKLLWENLKGGKPSVYIVKNKAKSGKFYWVAIDFKVTLNSQGKIQSINSNQKGIDNELVNKYIKPLYKNLSDLEEQSGIKSAENFLIGFLEERNRTLDDYFVNLLKTGKDSPNTGQKGFLSGIFG